MNSSRSRAAARTSSATASNIRSRSSSPSGAGPRRPGDRGRAAVAGEPPDVVEHARGQAARRGDERAQRGAPRAVRARLLPGAAADDGGAAAPASAAASSTIRVLPIPGSPATATTCALPARAAVERAAQARQLGVAADERLAVGGDRGDGHARRAAQPVERVAHVRRRAPAGPAAAWRAATSTSASSSGATPGAWREGGSGSAWRCCASSAGASAPRNGGRPHSSSHSVAPSA